MVVAGDWVVVEAEIYFWSSARLATKSSG
jgi:hypothetical protein